MLYLASKKKLNNFDKALLLYLGIGTLLSTAFAYAENEKRIKLAIANYEKQKDKQVSSNDESVNREGGDQSDDKEPDVGRGRETTLGS